MRYRFALLLLLQIISIMSFADSPKYLMSNEEVIFSFRTKANKLMYLAKDKNDGYIVYRYGTKNNIELEYPVEKDKSSWSRFEYSFWLRGGGIDNEGIDLNYVAFVTNGTKYVIYDTYFAKGRDYAVGIRVIDVKTEKVLVDVPGNRKTRQGAMHDLRENDLIKAGEEIYD